MGLAAIVATVVDAPPGVHYAEPNRHGYVVCDVTPEAVEATFRYVSTTAGPRAEIADGPTAGRPATATRAPSLDQSLLAVKGCDC